MNDSANNLVADVQAGQKTAFAEYLAVVNRPLLAYAARRMSGALRGKVEPDDVVQEALAEASRTFAVVDLANREPFHWLCQLCERRIVDAHRRYFGAQKRAAHRETPFQSSSDTTDDWGDLLAQSITTPSEAFSRHAREARLAAALKTLAADAREAIRLRYVECLPSKEIAATLGKSDAATRVLLSRSLKRLQRALTDEGERAD